MTTNPQGGGFQQQVLRSFTALMLLRPNWSGELVLGLGLNEEGTALALAAHLAGAVCLSIEPDVALVKAAQRRGACDFAVNTLDEALRTLKNEVRQGRPLAVALHGDLAVVLTEAAERGLLPTLIFGHAGNLPQSAAQAITQLQQLGANLVCLGGCGALGCTNAEAFVETWAAHHGYQLHTIPVASPAALSALDDALKLQLNAEAGAPAPSAAKPSQPATTGYLSREPGSGNPLRLRWLDRARQHFLRDRPLTRAAWLTQPEVDRLEAATQRTTD